MAAIGLVRLDSTLSRVPGTRFDLRPGVPRGHFSELVLPGLECGQNAAPPEPATRLAGRPAAAPPGPGPGR